MKLKTKLTAAVLGVFASVFALCGTFSAISLKNYSLDTAASEEREKLAIAGRAFRQVGTREDFEEMGEIARDAYLKYQFPPLLQGWLRPDQKWGTPRQPHRL